MGLHHEKQNEVKVSQSCPNLCDPMAYRVDGILYVLICGGLGIAAWLCWKNQTIRIVDDDTFEYTTFLGKTTVYRFSDIKELRVNQDSMTLILANGKVHIESMVHMSETLANKIDQAINKNDTP